MTRNIRIGRWCITIQRGGQATPWPWTEIRLSRRQPRPVCGVEHRGYEKTWTCERTRGHIGEHASGSLSRGGAIWPRKDGERA